MGSGPCLSTTSKHEEHEDFLEGREDLLEGREDLIEGREDVHEDRETSRYNAPRNASSCCFCSSLRPMSKRSL